MHNLFVGARWAQIEITDLYSETVTTKHNGITEKIQTRFLEYRCSGCGRTQTMGVSEFPGRRKLKDCGCGSYTGEKGRITSAYIDAPTYAGLSKYAKEQGITVSKAIVHLIREGIGQSQTVATNKARPSSSKGAAA